MSGAEAEDLSRTCRGGWEQKPSILLPSAWGWPGGQGQDRGSLLALQVGARGEPDCRQGLGSRGSLSLQAPTRDTEPHACLTAACE